MTSNVFKASLYLVILTTMLACSNDSNNSSDNGPITGNYYPSTSTNIWNYDVDNTSSTNPELNFVDAPDFVSIATSNGNTFTVEVNNGGIAKGIMNDILSKGTLTLGESTLRYSGNLQLLDDFDELSEQTISIQNALLYDLNASNNSIMSEFSGVLEEDLELLGTLIPLTIEYQVTSKKLSTSNSLRVNGETFSNVIHTQLVLNLNIFFTLPPFQYSIIEDQDILIIDNYFAEDIGLIKSEANQSYQVDQGFIDLLESNSIDLGLPFNLNVVNIQEINSYLVD